MSSFATDSGSSATFSSSTFWRRKLPLWILLAGLGFIIYRLIQAQPVTVDVVYHYGEARGGLMSASMRYIKDPGESGFGEQRSGGKGSEELRRVQFRYAVRQAGSTQRHRIQIPEGEYRVQIDLRYEGEPARNMAGGRPVRRVRIQRPLIVSGSGEVNIYITSSETAPSEKPMSDEPMSEKPSSVAPPSKSPRSGMPPSGAPASGDPTSATPPSDAAP